MAEMTTFLLCFMVTTGEGREMRTEGMATVTLRQVLPANGSQLTVLWHLHRGREKLGAKRPFRAHWERETPNEMSRSTRSTSRPSTLLPLTRDLGLEGD